MTTHTKNHTSGTAQVGEFTLTLRDATTDDMPAVLALHTLVFGAEVDAKWYHWKYGQAPHQGKSQGVGAWHRGELIAYCAGVPRKLWQQGQIINGLQIGDVMVHPDWRGIFTRRGPFYHVSKFLYDSRLGAKSSRPFQLGYGFPNERHARLGVMIGLGLDCGLIEMLTWNSLSGSNLPWSWHWHALNPTDANFDSTVNSAWQAMRDKNPELTLGQRDAAYFHWRYVDRPAAANTPADAPQHYLFFGLRRAWAQTCIGVAVLDLRSTSALWLDWVGPVDLMPMVCQACRIEAARTGATELTTWASATVSRSLVSTNIERRGVCAFLTLPIASDIRAEDIQDLRWWLQGGDTDFL